jgi:hypothetical protein
MERLYVQLHSFLTFALDGGAWLAPCPGRFTSVERAPFTFVEKAGWVPEPVWTSYRREKSVGCLGIRILDHPARSIVTRRTTLSRMYFLGLRVRIPPGHGCLSREYCVFFQVEVSATGRSLIQTSHTECDVFECNLETLTMKRPRPSRAVEP